MKSKGRILILLHITPEKPIISVITFFFLGGIYNEKNQAVPVSAASVTQAVSASSLTPAQAVQQAFAHYVQAGLDQNTALAKVQQNQARIITLSDDASIAAFVQSDLGSKVAVPASSVATASSLTPEAVVQQAYAQLIRQGMTSDQAMAAINANLPALLKNAGL
ncbi:MAG: hypothetical protein PUF49_08665 [Firmicutes bacterium]|nr:hypothetical protein [Bacillota bacterium]